ncbi:MAG: nucleoside-diphosphate sugar epimerase/dehydratase [Dermatophilaceae bacterium]
MPASGRNRRLLTQWLWAVLDAALWPVSALAGLWLRFDFTLPPSLLWPTLWAAALAGMGQVAFGLWLGPYAVSHWRGSYEEALELARVTLITTVVALGVVLTLTPPNVPRTIPVLAGPLVLTLSFGCRFAVRAWRYRSRTPEPHVRRALVLGAGDSARHLLRSLRAHDAGLVPVGLLDDDPRKSRFRLEGLRVLGCRDDLARVAAATTATTLVVAIPHASADLLREVNEAALRVGMEVLVMPPVESLLGPATHVTELRRVSPADLLGRRPVALDLRSIADTLRGKRVLVTGAGGSIGSELARQIAAFRPEMLCLLDRDESGLHATQLSIGGAALLDSEDTALADIRDTAALDQVFATIKPEIVFHAAALKHLPLLETHPLEAWKTNVLGTANVLEAAAAHQVAVFVNISTDKAADPISILGQSKRITERLTAGFGDTHPGKYISVRFGNVLGSRGSVLHSFSAQIARGGPITLTHPDVERYFMLIPEACQLVLQATALGQDGDVLVLDMGEPKRIADVAKLMIEMSGRQDIDIVVTGLRHGEKLTEELFGADEVGSPTDHPLVTRVAAPPVDITVVRTAIPLTHIEAAELLSSHGTGSVTPQPGDAGAPTSTEQCAPAPSLQSAAHTVA